MVHAISPVDLHSSKILTIQQGKTRGVSSVGKPPGEFAWAIHNAFALDVTLA